jgi:hypothetical protein
MTEQHRQDAIDGVNTVYTCEMSNVIYVNMIKVPLFNVALFKVTSDPFIEVASGWV